MGSLNRFVTLVIVVLGFSALATVACGDGGSDLDAGAAGEPIPVEPDGGIGDGAEPLPGAEGDDDAGTWHGAQVAETNCPGTTWQRVEASDFSFSVPSDFVDQAPQGIDSEIGQWSNDAGIDVFYDYGWYSGSIASSPGAVVEPIDYSGIAGTQTIVTGEPNQMQVFFDEVTVIDGEPNLLALNVNYTAAADEIIARCIIGSLDWNLG